ncbi:UDP-N-acetylmuramoyl-L-alanine--D-glutamate ligase [Candidatus Nomurabacteria bacterium]|nr:UDP-N-acetylmuramoyl-L-alanine--D-glutamate ligase [Candidatus Nomurabacteria bacterium]
MVKSWEKKKVLIMGLGLQGGALQVALWLLKQGAQITITDLKNSQQLKSSLDQLKKHQDFKKIKFTLGKHLESDFVQQDLIIKNPGVPRESKFLKIAKDNNIPIINEAVMFFGLYPGKIIGVTGTRGKSTTSTLLHQILKTEIKDNVVAGNIATVPMFSILDKISKDSKPVLELSSWHLEDLAEYKRSPYLAIVTNVLIDHLNRYQNFAAYKQAKMAIVKNQKKTDLAILNYDNLTTKSFAKFTKAKVYYFSVKQKVPRGVYLKENSFYFCDHKKETCITAVKDWHIFGEANLSNAAAAICAAYLLKISKQNIAKACRNFKGVEYRFQPLGKLKNVEVFNDATASTPDATIAAISALENKKILLIAGGEDKELVYRDLALLIKKRKVRVVLLAGSASKKLLIELKKIKYPEENLDLNLPSLKTAFQKAKKYLNQADVLLFSPAAASFNMFANEFERAKQFSQLVKNDQK